MRAGGVVIVALATLGMSACGGSQQDAHEPSGNFKVQVRAVFPGKQKLAKRSRMVIVVKNIDSRPLPNPSVTINSFNRNSTQANLSDPSRPVFIVNTGPQGGESANQSTSSYGREVGPGQTATFVWNVTAVQAGRYKIGYTVSAGLYGKAKAVNANGRPLRTRYFVGIINNAAPHSTVNFKNGKTVEGG